MADQWRCASGRVTTRGAVGIHVCRVFTKPWQQLWNTLVHDVETEIDGPNSDSGLLVCSCVSRVQCSDRDMYLARLRCSHIAVTFDSCIVTKALLVLMTEAEAASTQGQPSGLQCNCYCFSDPTHVLSQLADRHTPTLPRTAHSCLPTCTR